MFGTIAVTALIIFMLLGLAGTCKNHEANRPENKDKD